MRRLRSPDLDVQEEFLTDFGMVRVGADGERRSTCAAPIRSTTSTSPRRATPAFLGMAWHAKSEDDLKAVAKAPGASGVEHIDEPGGGMRVRLKEPNGYTIEVVYGMEAVLPIQVKRQAINSGPEPLEPRAAS